MKLFKNKPILISISMFLVITILVGSVQHLNIIKSKASDSINATSTYENDGLYESTLIDEQNVKNCEVKGLTDAITEIISYKENGSKCISKISSTCINKYYYDENNNMIYTETINFNELENGNSQTTKSVPIQVFELYNMKHWYQFFTKDYLIIGCDWRYGIRLEKLSKSQRANVNEYVDAIKTSNKSILTAVTALSVLIAATRGKIIAVIASVLEAKKAGMATSAIAKMLLTKFGVYIKTKAIALAVANKILDAIGVADFFDNRAKLKKYYKMIRDYGMLISKN